MNKILIFFIINFFLLPTAIYCQNQSTLMQLEKWRAVHPRPVNSKLRKAGTFQSWFDGYQLIRDTYTIYEPNQFDEAIPFSYYKVG